MEIWDEKEVNSFGDRILEKFLGRYSEENGFWKFKLNFILIIIKILDELKKNDFFRFSWNAWIFHTNSNVPICYFRYKPSTIQVAFNQCQSLYPDKIPGIN